MAQMDSLYPGQTATPFAHQSSQSPQPFFSHSPHAAAFVQPSQQPFSPHHPQQQHQQHQQHPQHQQPLPHSLHHSPPPGSSSSPSPFQSDPHARFAHQPAQHQWNGAMGSGYPLASSSMSMSGGMGPTSAMPTTNMLPPGMVQQQQQQQMRGSQNFLSNAPYTQGTPPPAVSTPQHQRFNSTVTPPNQGSAHVTPQSHNRPPNTTQAPSQTSHPQAMAAIQTSQPPTASQGTPVSAAKQSPTTPISPGMVARERQRVTLLLDINRDLLQEIINLQAQGKGGPIGQQVPSKEEDIKGPNAVKQLPSKEFVDCMRCLQSNLAYLAQLNPNKPVVQIPPRGPAIMDAPSTPASLEEQYSKLRALFPGWNGMPKKSPGSTNVALPGQQQQTPSGASATQSIPGNAVAAST